MTIRTRIALCTALCLSALVLPLGLARAQDETTPDPRLEQKITYVAYSTPLQKVGDDLTKKTGVVIRVGSGDRDWRAKERKVHLNLLDLPLGTALHQISQALGYELRRTGDEGKWSYRIWQNNRSREYEDAMLISEKDQADQDVAKIRESLLKDADDVAAMKPEDAAALREKDPWKAYLGSTDSGRNYSKILRDLPQDTRELMLRGRKVTLENSELSPDSQAAMQKMTQGLVDKILAGGPAADAFKNINPARIVFQPLTPDMGGGDAGAMGMVGMAWIMGDPKDGTPLPDAVTQNSMFAGLGKGMPMIAMPLAGSDSIVGRIFGKMLMRVEAGEPWGDVQKSMIGQMQSAQAQGEDQLKKIVPTPKPTDPALLVMVEPLKLKVDLTRNDSQSADMIKQLEAQTHLSYVQEYYPEEIPVAMALPAQKTPLYQFLDRLQLAGLTWEYEKRVVRIRPKNWAVQRSYDVPESTLASYRSTLKDKGWFDLDDLGGLVAALTDGQIQHRILVDRELAVASPGLLAFGGGGRSLLRFYGTLNAAQKAQIRTTQGLAFDQLQEPQWQLLSSVVEEGTGGAEMNTGKISLSVKDDITMAAEAQKETAKPEEVKTEPASDKPEGDAKTGTKPDEKTDLKIEKPDPKSEKAGASDKKDAAKAKEAPAPPKDAPEPMVVTAEFTVEVAGDTPDKPTSFKRTVIVPTRAQIKLIRKQIEDLTPKPEDAPKPPKAEETKPNATKPAPPADAKKDGTLPKSSKK